MADIITRKNYKLITPATGAAGDALNDNFTRAGDDVESLDARVTALEGSGGGGGGVLPTATIIADKVEVSIGSLTTGVPKVITAWGADGFVTGTDLTADFAGSRIKINTTGKYRMLAIICLYVFSGKVKVSGVNRLQARKVAGSVPIGINMPMTVGTSPTQPRPVAVLRDTFDLSAGDEIELIVTQFGSTQTWALDSAYFEMEKVG